MSEPAAIVNSTASKAASLMKTWAPLAAAPVGYAMGDFLGVSSFCASLMTKYTQMDSASVDTVSTIIGVLVYLGSFFAFWRGGVFGKIIAWLSLGIAFGLFLDLKSGVVA